MISISCSKEDYRTDSGLAKNATNLTTYDYLANNSYHYFDTLLMIVDHLGLKDSLNNSGSFFAPTDYAIHRLMTDSKITSLDAFYKKINSKFLTQYMFSDTSLTLDNASTSAKTFENWAGFNSGISKIAGVYTVASSALTYYTLQYIHINGVLDGSVNAPSNDEADAILKCQTTGIKTASGTNLNVLVNNATLNLIGDTVNTELSLSYDLNVLNNNDYTSYYVQLDSSKIASLFGLTTTEISKLINEGVNGSNDTLMLYNLDADSVLNNTYSATAPGFWYDSNGYVTTWGNNSVFFAELNSDNFNVGVGVFPGATNTGDSYAFTQVLVYLSPDGNTYKVMITYHITITS